MFEELYVLFHSHLDVESLVYVSGREKVEPFSFWEGHRDEVTQRSRDSDT